MNVVFANTFENSKTKDKGVAIITEIDGVWISGWGKNEPQIDVVWYNGMSLEELLSSFRQNVATKFKEGYRPDLKGMPSDDQLLLNIFQKDD